MVKSIASQFGINHPRVSMQPSYQSIIEHTMTPTPLDDATPKHISDRPINEDLA